MPHRFSIILALVVCPLAFGQDVDFNTDIRPILSNKCFACHGPDEANLEAGLRLDDAKIATGELGSGSFAIVAGNPAESELIARITSEDDDRMPPAEFGKSLSPEEIDKLRRWIKQGAKYAKHWSYVKPVRPVTPKASGDHATWSKNDIDHFALRAMLAHGFKPSPTAGRRALARRVSLDLTGLPPSIEDVEKFVADKSEDAYEKFVDRLLQSSSYGEHWARKWLDLARYADSAGYADDPPRTIWAYRDWVIKAINENMPFDQFTIEQMAGDLLPNPTERQLVATAFHRNTLTNNEGGTQDEEFRNVAVVDRVNTTMAVWMGTTMACAQCHTHKYDPITQTEYFQFFAILNNTQDRDRRNEEPIISLFTDDQKSRRTVLGGQLAKLKKEIETPTTALAASQAKWEQSLRAKPRWADLPAKTARRTSGQEIEVLDNGRLLVETESLEQLPMKDNYVVNLPLAAGANFAAVRLSTLPYDSLPSKGPGHSGGNFVITGLKAQLVPLQKSAPEARFVRITNNGQKQILSLAEVQVFSGGANVATEGKAKQHSTGYNGPAKLAIDGNTDGNFDKKSTTHTDTVTDPWWEVDLGSTQPIEKVSVWNRTDNNLQSRLANFTVELLADDRSVVWTREVKSAPKPSAAFSPSNVRDLEFTTAIADYEQPGFTAPEALAGKTGKNDGWAIGGAQGKPHHLVLVPKKPVEVTEPTALRVTIQQQSPWARHLIGHFGFSTTTDATAIKRAALPSNLLAVLDKNDQRTDMEAKQLASWYRSSVAPELAKQRTELAKVEQQIAGIKPATSVPVLRDLAKPRETRLQHRGNYLDKGDVVSAGIPAVFHKVADEELNRLALAKWLVSDDNPLTARVIANRYWESLFGRGIVLTSEEFGNQGELPTHPELLDWLATELVRTGWDTKAFLKTIVMSATYQQSATVPATGPGDPDNRWLARGPRVRLTAEMVRDQALFAAGLLSNKMYGAPVKPPQPDMGLKAAFGGSTDWKASKGEDRYRRGLYTTWRRSNPYPSMATFDAPNREVCTVRRNRTNTPLQSLVTLNDPVYVEAAQSLARLALQHEGSIDDQIQYAFQRCTLRLPSEKELAALAALFKDSREQLAEEPEEAKSLATEPLGMLPDGMDATDAAAMTVVANVLLNLDEMFLKR